MSYFRFSPVLSILSSISRGYEPSEVKAGSFWLANRSGKQFVIQLEASEVKAGSFWLAIRAGKQFVVHLEPFSLLSTLSRGYSSLVSLGHTTGGSFWLAIRAGKQFVIQLEPSEVKTGSFWLANGRGQIRYPYELARFSPCLIYLNEYFTGI